MDKTNIAWADSTLNFVTGCDRVSEGCGRAIGDEDRPLGSGCYAESLAERYRGTPAFPVGFDIQHRPHKLKDPARWKDPRFVFVNSMSDFAHRNIPDEWRDAAMDVFMNVPRHQYLILTKRPERLAHYLNGWIERHGFSVLPGHIWPGTSIELAKYNYRADRLRSIPSPRRFISAEPLLGPLLNVCATCAHHAGRHGLAGCHDCMVTVCAGWDPGVGLNLDGIAWVIVGGESGPGWRPMDAQWARDIHEHAQLAGTSFFYKQGAAHKPEHNRELDGVVIQERPPALDPIGRLV